MSKSREKDQRKRMWLANPHCHYCGIETLFFPSHDKSLGLTREQKERLATIDHIYPRHHPERRRPARGEVRHVLACHKCNNERDRRELAEKKEWCRQQSNARPLTEKPTELILKLMEQLKLVGKPRGPIQRQKLRRAQEAISWALWERGELDKELVIPVLIQGQPALLELEIG